MSEVEDLKFVWPVDYLSFGDDLEFEKITGQPIENVFAPRAVRDADGNVQLDDDGLPIKVPNPPKQLFVAWLYVCLKKCNPDKEITYEYVCELNRNDYIIKVDKAIFGDEYEKVKHLLEGGNDIEKAAKTKE